MDYHSFAGLEQDLRESGMSEKMIEAELSRQREQDHAQYAKLEHESKLIDKFFIDHTKWRNRPWWQFFKPEPKIPVTSWTQRPR
jgi:hypothetical protein